MTESQRINVAAYTSATRALGPGLRSALWVQGCPFRCSGCIAPEWQEDRINQLMDIESLADILLSNPNIGGITLSGGEPFQQAAGLGKLIQLIQSRRGLDVICFSGYSLDALRQMGDSAITDLLSLVDVLIDGNYVAEQHETIGLRGSKNQVIHYLSDRLVESDLEHFQNKLELHINNGDIFTIGIPSKKVLQLLDGIVVKPERFVVYERA